MERGLGAVGLSAGALLATLVVGVLADGILRSSLERNFDVLVANPTAWALVLLSVVALAVRSLIRRKTGSRQLQPGSEAGS